MTAFTQSNFLMGNGPLWPDSVVGVAAATPIYQVRSDYV